MKKIVNLKASEFLNGGTVESPLNTNETDSKEIHIPFSEDEINLTLEKVDIVFGNIKNIINFYKKD